jgi:methylated-DNA-[protein]-cysteine S-methyltransferase
MKLQVSEMKTPVGPITIVAGENGVCSLEFSGRWDATRRRLEQRFGPVEFAKVPTLPAVTDRIEAYLTGTIDALEEIAVDPGGTPFQQKVWSALRKIRAGETLSYGSLARKIGSPTGARAVATANASNPIAIVIPCHRVIGSNGALRGYAGGVDRKRWLLEHEGVLIGDGRADGSPLEKGRDGTRHQSRNSIF